MSDNDSHAISNIPSEFAGHSETPAKDYPLRRDVSALGALLGQVLVEQAGQELFDTVETLRRLMIEHRYGHSFRLKTAADSRRIFIVP